MAKEEPQPPNPAQDAIRAVKGGAIVIALLLVIGTITSAVYTVEPGTAGVMFDQLANQINPAPVGVGLHLKAPWQVVYPMETRTTKTEFNASAASRDLQNVEVQAAVNTHISAEAAPRIFREIGPDYADRIIAPALQESVKASTAKYDAADLIVQRERVKGDIFNELSARLLKYGISLDEFSIVDFDFSADYNAAIEEKVVVEQNRQKSALELEQIKIEAQKNVTLALAQAQAAIATANGTATSTLLTANADAGAILAKARAEAEALRIQKEELTPELLELRSIQAYSARWDGRLPQYILGGNALPIVNVPLATQAIAASQTKAG